MTPLTDAELSALVDAGESDRAERKESWSGSASETGAQAVCAFANDLPGHDAPGVLFVGIKDDGTPSQLPITDDLLKRLADDFRGNANLLPPVSLVIEKRTIKGAEVAVVTVLPAEAPPVRYKGRIWVRVGPSRRLATAQDERVLAEKRRHKDKLSARNEN
jgi:ATP-dependent DNA helicase RecG